MKPPFVLHGLIAASILFVPSFSFAQFSPAGATISSTVGAQTLSASTGTINSGGKISIASGSTVPLGMSGTSTLINNGTIETLGSGRAIDSNSGIATLTVTNTGLISSVSTDAFRVNTNSAVSLTNSGTIRVTNGGQAIDWAAITSKSNTLTNQSGGVISAVGEDAVRPGTNGVVNNAGSITATPTGSGANITGSDGIDVRTFTGIQITNTGSISGRHGIATDGANAGPSALTVNNNTGGTITAFNGSGLNIDGVSTTVTASVTNQAGATIQGGVLAVATDGDGDGIDVDGVLTLNNYGTILALGAKGSGSDSLPNGAQAVSIGGGSIHNYATGQIVGSSLPGDAPNGDSSRVGEGILSDNSSGANAIAVTSIINEGLIRGKSGAAIRVVGTFADSITNNAGGTIRGAGTGAAIQSGNGANTVINRGAIVGDNGSAIDLQGGNDDLLIEGGAASISGSVSGGSGTNTLTLDLGTGQTFTNASSFSNFNRVEIKSGSATFAGVSSYLGTTKLSSGGKLILDGAGRLASTSPLDLSGGYLKITNAGGANGQSFASLTLGATSTIDLDDSTSLTFGSLAGFTAGQTLAVIGYEDLVSPGYAIRFLGDLTANSTFLALAGATTIDGGASRFRFDGTYTDIAPVPEPSTFAFGLALCGALGCRRRRLAR